MNKALIFGVTGQDGSYLSELLLSKGWKVDGVSRRTSTNNTDRIKHLLTHTNFSLLNGDVTDYSSVFKLINNGYNHIYNLAAQSQVGTSFEQPNATFDITAKGCFNILEAIKNYDWTYYGYKPRMYQASSSEMFGDQYTQEILDMDIWSLEKFQDEQTPFNPQSPYAIAKLAAHNMCRLYRNSYEMDVRTGILFNHESERRGEYFVTRKITKWLGEYKNWYNPLFEQGFFAQQDWDNRLYNSICDSEGFTKLRLGNLDSCRDWTHAEDAVEAMYLIMQHDTADDFVVGTGETHTIKEFLIEAFNCIGIDNWQDYVVIDDNLKRPSEVPFLKAKPDKAKKELGWEPKCDFKTLVKKMVEHDIKESSTIFRLMEFPPEKISHVA